MNNSILNKDILIVDRLKETIDLTCDSPSDVLINDECNRLTNSFNALNCNPDDPNENKILICNNLINEINAKCTNENKQNCEIYTNPYLASCPDSLVKCFTNNEYKCYKDCSDNTKSGEIINVDYKINRSGKQCIKKSFISQ